MAAARRRKNSTDGNATAVMASSLGELERHPAARASVEPGDVQAMEVFPHLLLVEERGPHHALHHAVDAAAGEDQPRLDAGRLHEEAQHRLFADVEDLVDLLGPLRVLLEEALQVQRAVADVPRLVLHAEAEDL